MSRAESELLHRLSFLALNPDSAAYEIELALRQPETAGDLLNLADLHHVLLRLLVSSRSKPAVEELYQSSRLTNMIIVRCVAAIYNELEAHGCPTMAIKASDHWPDLGNDFDLFTTGAPETVLRVMQQRFNAEVRAQSWGDKLANKWNFKVPGLHPLVEIHISRLGQTGELVEYGHGLIARCRMKDFEGVTLAVPSAEDQIILSALQRLYRHFFYRICDFVDTTAVVNGSFDYERLRSISKSCHLWGGVATHLRIVSEYIAHYRGHSLSLPAFVRKAAHFGIERIYPHAGYLRLPLFPHGAKLYGYQVLKNVKRGDHAGAMRLSLLPPLAAAAGAAFGIGGKREGVW